MKKGQYVDIYGCKSCQSFSQESDGRKTRKEVSNVK